MHDRLRRAGARRSVTPDFRKSARRHVPFDGSMRLDAAALIHQHVCQAERETRAKLREAMEPREVPTSPRMRVARVLLRLTYTDIQPGWRRLHVRSTARGMAQRCEIRSRRHRHTLAERIDWKRDAGSPDNRYSRSYLWEPDYVR